MNRLQRIAQQTTAPTPQQVQEALLELAETLPSEQQKTVRMLAKNITMSEWYCWQKMQTCPEIRTIDLQEACGKISPDQAAQMRIAVAIRGIDA